MGKGLAQQKNSGGIYFVLSFLFWLSLVSCDDSECPPSTRPKILYAELGTYKLFTTPGFYRGVYPPNQDCHWIIRSPGPEAWIQLIVYYSRTEDRLFTECDDFMEIRDGSTNESPVLLKWCGYFNPSAFSSVADALYVRFKSDQFLEDGRGVNMSYVAYSRPGCPPGWQESTTGMCYHLVSPKPPFPKMSWVDAQNRCSYERSNLLTVTSYNEYEQVIGLFQSTGESPWVGITDAQDEGQFVSVDPNAKLYPDPFHTASNDASRDCVYLDLKNGGPAVYDVDDCRVERSYLCQRRKDGSTVSYPPPESVIRQSLVAAAGLTWNPVYLWLLAVVVVLLIVLVCVPWMQKRYKRHKNNQMTAPSDTDSHNILIQNNAAATSPNNGATNTVESGSHMPPPSNLITDYHITEGKLIETATIHTMPRTAVSRVNDGALTYRKPLTDNSDQQENGNIRDIRSGSGKSRRMYTVAPIEKFGRPVIRPLDNVSAISLDEYWHRIEVERIRNIEVRESPPVETSK